MVPSVVGAVGGMVPIKGVPIGGGACVCSGWWHHICLAVDIAVNVVAAFATAVLAVVAVAATAAAVGGVQETIERDLEKLGNVLKMRERSMLYSMKLETKIGRLNQMLEVSKLSVESNISTPPMRFKTSHLREDCLE